MQIKKAENAVLVGDRAAVVKHHDNLKMEGSFAGVQSEAHSSLVQAKGERAEVKKRQDNLKMEGSMQLVSEARSAAQAIQKVNFKSGGGRRDVHSSSIVIGD